jgi:hypothetical protein
MKFIIKILLIILAILLGEQQLQAQGDSNRINSEIRIAESILEEIFKSPDSNARNFFPGGQKLVQGEYIPGIGVHFKVSISQSRFYMSRDSSKTISGSVVTKEWVEERMLEYYNGYAAQLRSVPDREQVRITYGSDTINRSVFIIGRRQEISYERPETITAWASMADIKAYASGNLSERQFRDRLTIQDISEQSERRDLNIFASVLETAMNSTETEHLRVRREPTYEYLPGYGAHFHVRVGTGSSFSFGILEDVAVDLDELALDDFDINIDLGEIDVDQNRFEFDLDSMDVSIERMADSMKVYAEGIRIDTAQLRQHAEQARQQAEQMRQRFELRIAERDSVDLSGDAEVMMDELIQTMRDYSGTLSSLEEDQLVVVTVHWEGRNPSLPERTQIRITKGDLQRGAEPEIEEIRRR